MSRGKSPRNWSGERFRRDGPMSNDLLERRMLALERRMDRVEFRVGLASPPAPQPASEAMHAPANDDEAVAAILTEDESATAAPAPARDESLAAHLRALR